MKGILKVRNLDSLKILSYKRAEGRLVNVNDKLRSVYTSILLLEELGLLTREMLWDLIEFRKICFIESRKLQYVMSVRKRNARINKSDMFMYIHFFSNINNAILRVPDKLRDKYGDYITDREQKGNENNGRNINKF